MRDGIWADGEYFEAESGFGDERVQKTELNRRESRLSMLNGVYPEIEVTS
jgi:hypothetical protein